MIPHILDMYRPKVVTDKYFGMPEVLHAKTAWRINTQDVDNFTFRNDGFDDYFASYTDPISTELFEQLTGTEQPLWLNTGLNFDGIDDVITNSNVPTYKELWIVCNSLDGATFDNFDCLFSVPGFAAYIYAKPSDTVFDPLYVFGILETRVNNVLTLNFAPLANMKTVANTLNLEQTEINIGKQGAYHWNGDILDVIAFNTELLSSDRTAMYDYLVSFHSL